MAGRNMNVKRLTEERASLLKQIENLQSELKGLDRAIRLMSGDSGGSEATGSVKGSRGKNVKETILTLVTAASPTGQSVSDLMDEARMKGIKLERASVSSLLSRLKKEGVLHMEGGKYFVPMGGGSPH